MNDEQARNHWPEHSPRMIGVRPGNRYRLEITFDNGVTGSVDFEGRLIGAGGVMAPLANLEFFRQVSVDEKGGTIRWPNGVDLCPDVLYSRATGIAIPFAKTERPTIVR